MAPKRAQQADEASTATLLARAPRAALEALLLSYESVLPKERLRSDLLSQLEPAMVRTPRIRGRVGTLFTSRYCRISARLTRDG